MEREHQNNSGTRRNRRIGIIIGAATLSLVTAGAVIATIASAGTNGSNAATGAEAAAATLGWATQSGGTKGGSEADAKHIYTVKTKAELIKALDGTHPDTGQKDKTAKKIIKWSGTIDMTEGTAFSSQSDQKNRAEILVTPNTTIIGVGSDAYLPNGWFKISKVDNVIIRNIKITNPCDIAPKWDANDSGGNYNSEFDGMTVDGSTHVWVDHMWFTDAPKTDDTLPLGNTDTSGVRKRVQCHDGALDVKNASDYVTVSNTIFEQHSKNILVGHSDGNTADEGHLTVSFIGNLYRNIGERAPRVRFGKVHLANNYFVGSKTDAAYPHNYSVGTGYKSKIISDNNVFDITGATAGSCAAVVKNPGSSAEGALKDSGSQVGGSALTGCTASTEVGWTVPYTFTKLETSQVKTSVLGNAGTGKI